MSLIANKRMLTKILLFIGILLLIIRYRDITRAIKSAIVAQDALSMRNRAIIIALMSQLLVPLRAVPIRSHSSLEFILIFYPAIFRTIYILTLILLKINDFIVASFTYIKSLQVLLMPSSTPGLIKSYNYIAIKATTIWSFYKVVSNLSLSIMLVAGDGSSNI